MADCCSTTTTIPRQRALAERLHSSKPTAGPVTSAIAAMRTDEPEPPRRGFLRGLLTLPLIGGGVHLIGAPSAVAEPVSERLMREYTSWLAYEWSRASMETFGNDRDMWFPLHGPAYQWHRERGDRLYASEPPSTRAALVLSAVGCNWR